MSKVSVLLFGMILFLNCRASGECLVKIETVCGYEDTASECVLDEGGTCGGLEYHAGLDDGPHFDWIEEGWPFDRVQPEEIYEFSDIHYQTMDCGDFNYCYSEWDENENIICKSDPSTVFHERVLQNSTTACVEF